MPKLNYSRKSPALIDLDGPDGNAFAVVGLAAEHAAEIAEQAIKDAAA